ncbi:hypothetical protein [Shewanella algicola]|jgi:hypothetical protein|uniref:hypothetical protein n=1 Tax=Shewanella algicola TaxID=640633 RepID=UPI0024950A38|nr:hypothetical protein [Shewanella algicola]
MHKRMFSPTLRRLNIGLVFFYFVGLPAIAANQSVSFDVLNNTSYDGCPYSGEVAISVEYDLVESNVGQLIVSAVNSGRSYELTRKDVEHGPGSAVFVFELQECIERIDVALTPF